MDWKALAEWLWGELAVITHVSFWIVVGLVAFVIWKVVQREYAMRLANADSTIVMLKERLERSETSDAMAIAATSQQLEVSELRPAPSSPAVQRIVEPPTPESPPPEAVSSSHAASPAPIEVAPITTAENEIAQEGRSAKDLMGLLEGRTTLQSAALIDRELGKRIVLEGNVRQVNPLFGGEGALMALRDGEDLIFCLFSTTTPELEGLSIGEIAKVEGRLSEIKTMGITLEECVLISSRPASASPPS